MADKENCLKDIQKLLALCTPEQREQIFVELQSEFGIHPLEKKLNARAEVILEAIARSGERGLTFRMIRGVIAQAAFATEVIEKLPDWLDLTPPGDLPYDFLLSNGAVELKIQVKLQRSEAGRPMSSGNVPKRYQFTEGRYVVETQRTRGGTRRKGVTEHTEELVKSRLAQTRPYRFGEFDILAVSMSPSTDRWDKFMFTVANWLLPAYGEEGHMLVYQPVSVRPDEDWTDDYLTCVSWFLMNKNKTITR
jgi:hypothetical protein